MAPPSIIASDVQSTCLQNGTKDQQLPTENGRLTIDGTAARRAQSAAVPTGTAAVSNSDMFKGPMGSKPRSQRWDHILAPESKARTPSSLKSAFKYFRPGLISLGGGLPSSDHFPIDRLNFSVPRPPKFQAEQSAGVESPISASKGDIAEGRSLYDLRVALNYGNGYGSPPLLRFVTEHTEIIHNPPYQDWHCCLTIGNTSGLDIALRMLTRPGDFIMTEEYAYPASFETAAPMGVRPIGVRMCEEGLLPWHLDQVLSSWDPSAHDGAPRPRVLYTIPSGQNPTGATQSLQRRRELYAVAQKHDLFIIEDDPYYYLQMDPYEPSASAPGPTAPAPKDETAHDSFLAALVPSLLAIDTDGRVLRLDSFSKIIFPGSRCGWVTGPAQLVERIVRHTECSVQGPSGLSQLVLYKLLDETWGHAGFLEWLVHLRAQYTERRDVMLECCEQYLPREVASWTPPAAGMFIWIHIAHERHPSLVQPMNGETNGNAESADVQAIENEVFQAAIEHGVLAIPGSKFRAEKGLVGKLFFRVTFAFASAEDMATAIRRFGAALGEVFDLGESVEGN